MTDIIRWRPLPDRKDPPGPVDSRVAYRKRGQTFYSVWPAGRPEPTGNPVKWAESTLRELYEKDQGAGE